MGYIGLLVMDYWTNGLSDYRANGLSGLGMNRLGL